MHSKITFLAFTSLFWVFSNLSAQSTIDVVKNKNDKFGLVEADANTTPTHTNPVSGSITVVSSGNIHKFYYSPNKDFIGQDTFSVSFLLKNIPTTTLFNVTVRQAKIIAIPDLYAYDFVKEGEQLMSVTENDIDEETGLKPTISLITSKNNGIFTIAADRKDILFTPVKGFSGVANITYLVCNVTNEVCSQTTASIIVPNPKDTFEVFTPKFSPINLPIPKDFTLQGAISNGTIKTDGHFQVFTPNASFEGKESMLFKNAFTNQQIFVNVNVLSKRKNIYAFDDFTSLTPGSSVSNWNLLTNDNIKSNPSFRIISQPKFGKLSSIEGSRVTYEAPNGSNFSGVDQFTYELSQDGLDKEMATVYIKVSKFEPVSSVFNFYTPKGVTLKVGNTFPSSVNNIKLEIKKRGNGDLVVNADNTLTYDPLTINSGVDNKWEIDYLVSDKVVSTVNLIFNILNESSVTSSCLGADCVWSGDTNNDGIVSLSDLLPIGRYLGSVHSSDGPLTTESWYGKKASDWDNVSVLKYVNTNGDRFITDADTLAVRKYLGNTHGIIAKDIPIQNFTVKLKGNTSVKPGEAVNLDVFIGDKSKPAIDLYGFTLSLPFNKQIFDLSKSSITFDSRSWLAYNSPVFALTNSNNDRGVMEAAYTRTSGKAADGFGKVGTARIIVIDIAGIKPPNGSNELQVTLGGGQATASDANGNAYSLYVEPFTLTIDFSDSKEKATPTLPVEPILSPRYNEGGEIGVFPNPATDFVNIKSFKNSLIKTVQLVNMSGQILFESNNINQSEIELSIANRVTGMYYVRVLTENAIVTRKLQILQR
ncbi:MAG: Ig-like domain-containing protein [Bacteroidota bacterium]